MYAIIETGGKQYKVAEGDIITVEKLGVEAGQEYTFDKVLVLAKDGDVKVGAPYVEGAAVTASVIGDGKAKKVVVQDTLVMVPGTGIPTSLQILPADAGSLIFPV